MPCAHSVAYALYHAAVLHCLRREAQLAQARAEAVMALAREQKLPLSEKATRAMQSRNHPGQPRLRPAFARPLTSLASSRRSH
jgi:hypothetical protein